jgi:hypothetical protein
MWGRIGEIVLGIWLLLSPYVWGSTPFYPERWRSDMISGIAVIGLAVLSFWPFRKFEFLSYAHVGSLLVAGWVVGFSYFYAGHPAALGYQNDLLTGLTLLLFPLIPNHASQPPIAWRRYYLR